MARINFLQNRRLVTLALLAITLIFGGIAVFLAVTINNRSLNPDVTSAKSCSGDDDCTDPGSYCDRTSCPGRGFCCTGDCSKECGCKIVQETTCSGCPAGQGRSKRIRKCPGKPDEDVSDSGCTAKSECQTPGNTACPRSAIPGCGSGNASTGQSCSCVGTEPPTAANPSGQFTGRQVCNSTGWGGCIRADGSQPIGGTCPDGYKIINDTCVKDCNGTNSTCACGTNVCSGSAGQTFTCVAGACQIANGDAWLGSGNCRFSATQTGSCKHADFKGCNPTEGHMCWCEGPYTTVGNYTYGSASNNKHSNTECGGSCVGKPGGTYGDSICGNPYKCPAITTIPTVPVCNPQDYCLNNQRVKITCDANGNQVRTTTPEQCSTCPSTHRCIANTCQQETLDCNGNVTGTEQNSGCCRTTTVTPQLNCNGLTIKNGAGQVLQDGATINTGDTLTLTVDSTTAEKIASRYAFNDGTKFRVIKTQTAGANQANAYNDQLNPRTITFKVPSDLAGGTQVQFSSSNIFKIDANGKFVTTCAGGNCLTDPDVNIISCGAGGGTFHRAVLSPPLDVYDSSSGTAVITQSPNSYTAMGVGVQKIPNGASIQCIETNACHHNFVVANVPASACTGVTVTNTRTNATCNSTNPAACGLRQGDTINVAVAGSGNTTGYSMQTTANPGSTTQAFVTQASPTFSSIKIPTDRTLQTFDITGYTTNGATAPVTSTACQIKFPFSTNPTVDKSINAAGSTGLSANNVVTTGSVVEYDVKVANEGTTLLQNVLVYDRLFNVVNGVVDVNAAPFGSIISAANLSRTPGTQSTPNPVTPKNGYPSNKIPFVGTPVAGGTFTDAQGIKLVNWNPITAFYPAEGYSAKVRVQIDTYSGTPVLRNFVCLTVDANGNGIPDVTDTNGDGIPDTGEITKCDYEDVNTSTPQFTITKTSSDSVATPGSNTTYTLVLKNTSASPLALSGVTVTDTFDSRYIGRVTVTPANGGQVTNNTIVWDGTDLIALNSGGAQLAAGASLTMTVQITYNANFFQPNDECVVIIDNSVVASSTSPNYTTPPSSVQISMNNPACAPTGTPVTTLPPTGVVPPVYIPLGGIALVLVGFFAVRKLKWFRNGGTSVEASQSDPISDLRRKVKLRK